MSAPAWLGPVVRSYRMTPAPFDIAVAVTRSSLSLIRTSLGRRV